MRHIGAIKKMMEEGQVDQAKEALENLLELGPHNLEALKMKAALYAAEGRFLEEEKTWHQIIEISHDDEDALEFIQQRQIDFYFTDDLPGGGRRFLAYPQAFVKISLLGLLGCITFLLVTRLVEQKQWSLSPEVLFLTFLVLVISPWVGILYTWVKSLKNITISFEGLRVESRLKSHHFPWEDLKGIYLVYNQNPLDPELQLVLTPKDDQKTSVAIDLSEGSSSIRARSFLVNEVSAHSLGVEHIPADQFSFPKGSVVHY